MGAPVVVWDLGNVLIPWDRRQAMARIVADPVESERLAAEVFTLEVNHHLDAGRPLAEVRAVVESRHPGLGWVVDGYVEHFRASLGEVMEATVAIVEDLVDAGVRCVGLSNWSRITFEGIPEAYPALGLLEGVVISGDEGVCKPAAEIYRRCEQRFGFAPGDAVFVDDSAANVDAAAALGWRAIHFVGAAEARCDLAAAGLPL
jgi:2-haloacid dehalogenase